MYSQDKRWARLLEQTDHIAPYLPKSRLNNQIHKLRDAVRVVKAYAQGELRRLPQYILTRLAGRKDRNTE